MLREAVTMVNLQLAKVIHQVQLRFVFDSAFVHLMIAIFERVTLPEEGLKLATD
jgi:hypothetical protein